MNKNYENRILYLDVLKVISILMMVFIHTLAVFDNFGIVTEKFNTTLAYNISGIFNLFTPIIFMLCMGCGLYLSKNNTPKLLTKRGLKLLLIGLILNFFRGFLFFLIFSFIEDISYVTEAWYWLWGSDIMYFAGLFFLLYALMRKLNLKDIYILFISIIMFIISTLILNIQVSNYTLNMILGNFVYLNSDSYFPLLTWTIIPVVGYYYQKYYDKVLNKNKYVLMISFISFVLFCIGLLFFIKFDLFKMRYLLWGIDEQLIDMPTLLFTLLINFVYIGIIYFASKSIKTNKLAYLIKSISDNINIIYFIHWILIIYLCLVLYLFIPLRFNNLFQLSLIVVIIYLASIFIAKYLKRKK